MGLIMASKFAATIKETKSGKICIEIEKEDFENFYNACGLFRKEFIEYLNQSEQDHQQGRVTERESLFELMED